MDFYETRDSTHDFIPPVTNGRSEIEEFYNGSNVLITGVTGFIGNLVVEKLLRCCPGINKIYFLIRMKKNMAENQRALEVVNEMIFAKVKKQNPNFIEKIVVVASDCGLPNLGLSESDRQMMLDTNIIFHIAATLRFDDHFRNSFQTNVQATRDLLELAKSMKNLKAFTYVSTAYAHVGEQVLKEEFIKSKYSYREMKTMMDNLTDTQITALMPKLTEGNVTTYSIMKSMAENVVEEYAGEFPIGIVRPSIVISSYKEPLEGWIKGLNGPTAMFLGVLLGIMRVVQINREYKTDLIPADTVTSAILAATWDLTSKKYPFAQMSLPVYNIVSCKRSPITWDDMAKYYERTDYNHVNLGSERSMWEPFGIFTESRITYNILFLFLHIIPALLLDSLLQVKGKQPLLMKLYRKAYYLMAVMHIYHRREWEFEDDNLYAIWDKMAAQDREKFNFSLDNFDWASYYYNYARGLKVYLLKESMEFEAIQKCTRRRKILKTVHYATCTLLILIGLWFVKWLAMLLINSQHLWSL